METRKIKIFPTGMRLHEWIAFEEGYFREQGLDPEVMWDVYLGQMQGWSGGADGYKQRPQDQPFLAGESAIGNACAWGSVCNAGAGMGKFVPDAYGIARHAIFVRPDSRVRAPEDLRGVPVAVGLMAGSHYNVPYRLEKYLPLADIEVAPVGGFGRRLDALLKGEVEAASLLDPQIYMAEELGLRRVVGGEFNTLWWVDERTDPDVLRRYFTALDRAEQALDRDLAQYLPLWRKSVPPEFLDRPWTYESWGAGERFRFAPIPRAALDEVTAAIDRWGMGDKMLVKDVDRLALSVA
ncbi:MAG: ABC transporter substrate-binding protein [Candidatus Rokubacteria bacterium]|nr:ABC transporter substrate-binding protein [Candidatus Rokubacteria bacterium]